MQPPPPPKANARAPKGKAPAYGMGAARGPQVDARSGVVPGRQVIARSAVATLTSKDPISETSPFTQTDQNTLGGTRRLTSVIGGVVVSGQMPEGYTAQNLVKVVQDTLNVQILVQGQLIDSIPFSAFLDTRRQQRQLKMLLSFPPGAWGSVSFRFTTLGVEVPAPAPLPPLGSYQVEMIAKCVFDTARRPSQTRQG